MAFQGGTRDSSILASKYKGLESWFLRPQIFLRVPLRPLWLKVLVSDHGESRAMTTIPGGPFLISVITVHQW